MMMSVYKRPTYLTTDLSHESISFSPQGNTYWKMNGKWSNFIY